MSNNIQLNSLSLILDAILKFQILKKKRFGLNKYAYIAKKLQLQFKFRGVTTKKGRLFL